MISISLFLKFIFVLLLKELNRFIHYYTRYKNHDNSRLLEEPLMLSARRKMGLLAASLPAARSPLVGNCDSKEEVGCQVSPSGQAPACTRFIEEGIRELIKARRILCGSYVYGYYLEDNGYNKTIFEFMQVYTKAQSDGKSSCLYLFFYKFRTSWRIARRSFQKWLPAPICVHLAHQSSIW